MGRRERGREVGGGERLGRREGERWGGGRWGGEQEREGEVGKRDIT